MLEVKLNVEDINQHIIDAITESMLGRNLKEAIERAFQSKFEYQHIARGMIENFIRDIIAERLREDEDFKNKIKQNLIECMDDEFLDSTIKSYVHKMSSNL